MRSILKSKQGMTLIEMIITFALVIIASTVLLMGIQSIFGLTLLSETRKQGQAVLTQMVAFKSGNVEDGGESVRTATQGALALTGGYRITGEYVTYEKDGVRFTVFEGDVSNADYAADAGE